MVKLDEHDKDEIIGQLAADLQFLSGKLLSLDCRKDSEQYAEFAQAKRVTIKSLIELGAFDGD